MEGSGIIPERIQQMVNKITSTLMESGLYHRAHSIDRYHLKCPIVEEEADLDSFTLEQLKRPMMLIGFLWMLSSIVFIAEIIVFQWKLWRNRK